MSVPDFALRRPVFATVINLLIVLIGAVAVTRLPVRELPSVEVLEVVREDGEELLVPMVGDAIRSIDMHARRIDVDLGFLGAD